MSYRKIPADRILRFPSTAGFKGWKQFFTDESIAHPAKMNLKLLRHILEVHTSPGDVVLDPMAGTGSTIVIAAMLGRHGIAVEYEPHFCDMIRENIKRTEKQTTLTPKGKIICTQGDARELSKLLKESDAIITSPPYSESNITSRIGRPPSPKGHLVEHYVKSIPQSILEDLAEYMRERRETLGLSRRDMDKRLGTNTAYSWWEGRSYKGKYGVGRTISPRFYREVKNILGLDDRFDRWFMNTKITQGYSQEGWLLSAKKRLSNTESAGNIGDLSHGDIEAIITSPPYGNRLSDEAVQDGDKARMSYRQAIDSIVTSPPYEQTSSSKQHGQDPHPELVGCENINIGYSEDPENIGNLKSESYLEAMLQCYQEFYKVLKEGGIMVLVVKNFIRDKAVVRLDLDTIRLAEAVGFTLKDRWYFKLPTKSFWRLLYERKYPSAPKLLYEDVLIFGKEAEK